MQIPDRFVTALASHLRRVTAKASCAPTDSRTADAMRLLRRDLRVLERMIDTRRDGAQNDHQKSPV